MTWNSYMKLNNINTYTTKRGSNGMRRHTKTGSLISLKSCMVTWPTPDYTNVALMSNSYSATYTEIGILHFKLESGFTRWLIWFASNVTKAYKLRCDIKVYRVSCCVIQIGCHGNEWCHAKLEVGISLKPVPFDVTAASGVGFCIWLEYWPEELLCKRVYVCVRTDLCEFVKECLNVCTRTTYTVIYTRRKSCVCICVIRLE